MRYFDDNWYTNISVQDVVSPARMVAPLAGLMSIPLNELYRGNLVRSITLIPFEIF